MKLNNVEWLGTRTHNDWLQRHANELLDFYSAAYDPIGGGFWWLDNNGEADRSKGKLLWLNCRMVYSFAIGAALGHPGCDELVANGVDYLENGPLRDTVHGGWFEAIDSDGNVTDNSKESYGHAFVVLAAAAAVLVDHDADRLLASATEVIEQHFWDDQAALSRSTWNTDFSVCDTYRGQNPNMHLVEAYLLAADATGDPHYGDRANQISTRLIKELGASNGLLLHEHFDEYWNSLPDYGRDAVDVRFRPYGSSIGHWLEWARLLVQLEASTGTEQQWMIAAAETLFGNAIQFGWGGPRGGFAYSTDWEGNAHDTDRYHWVIAEAIGAAAVLYRRTGKSSYQQWYRKSWNFAATHHISTPGGWIHQLTNDCTPDESAWSGRPDLYHIIQALVLAQFPLAGTALAAINTDVRYGH